MIWVGPPLWASPAEEGRRSTPSPLWAEPVLANPHEASSKKLQPASVIGLERRLPSPLAARIVLSMLALESFATPALPPGAGLDFALPEKVLLVTNSVPALPMCHRT